MPTIPFPDNRTLVKDFKETIEDVECEIFVYHEENSAFFGILEWPGRHIRVETPYGLIHETWLRGVLEGYFLFDLPPWEVQWWYAREKTRGELKEIQETKSLY